MFLFIDFSNNANSRMLLSSLGVLAIVRRAQAYEATPQYQLSLNDYVNCFEKVTLPSDESDDNEADTKFMVEALNLRCMFDIIVKDWDSTNEGLKKALEIDPSHVQCRIKQSKILTEAGDVSGAFESLKEVQTQHPESYEVHFHLAQIYFILEQVDMAQACYQTAMELSPTFEQAHIQYGVSLCYFKPREEAAAFFKKCFYMLEINQSDQLLHQ